MLKPHIFRAYDIRGIADTDFDETGAEQIGLGYGTFIKKDNPDARKVVIGRDGRIHSEKFQKAFIKGVRKTGLDVIDAGLCTSPLVNFVICTYHLDGGVNITASHNPKEFNGFKLQRRQAHAIFGEEIEEIKDLIYDQKFILADQKGSLIDVYFGDQWLSELSSLINIKGNPKIVIDCGNGVGGQFAVDFFKRINCQAIPLYCEVDGNFPNHEANPEIEENLTDLKKKVLEEKALLGIAFDGDADRVGIIDEKGNHYAADLLLLILARDLLTRHPQAKIVYDLKATQILPEEIKKLGSEAIICKTGHSFIEKKMEETGALLGGEVSGHIFIAENYYGFDDAFLAAGKILEIIQNSKKPLIEHFINLPKTYVTPEIKVEISEEAKFPVVRKIVKHFKKKYGDKVLTIDGARIDFGDGAWGIVRASNTSPYLTTRFEARTEKKLKEIKEEIFGHLQSYKEIM